MRWTGHVGPMLAMPAMPALRGAVGLTVGVLATAVATEVGGSVARGDAVDCAVTVAVGAGAGPWEEEQASKTRQADAKRKRIRGIRTIQK